MIFEEVFSYQMCSHPFTTAVREASSLGKTLKFVVITPSDSLGFPLHLFCCGIPRAMELCVCLGALKDNCVNEEDRIWVFSETFE